MARKTKEEAEKTRQKLIHTALMLFSEKGVSRTTLTDISKAAGVTKGAFYWHFRNKLEIFEAIDQTYARPLDDQSDAMFLESEDKLAGFIEAVGFYFTAVEESPELQALFSVYFYKCEYIDEFAPLMKLDDVEMTETVDKFAGFIRLIPKESWRDGEVGDATLIASTVIDCLIGLLMRWIRNPTGSLADKAEQSIRLVLKGSGLLL